MALKTAPILADDVKHLDASKVDPSKAYYVTIQLGAKTRWRNFSGGRWESATETGGRLKMTHVPAMHKAGPMPGDMLIGLIGSHNRWREANATQEVPVGTISTDRGSWHDVLKEPVSGENGRVYVGDVNKQLLVVDWEETDDDFDDFRSRGRMSQIERVIEKTIEKTMGALSEQLGESIGKAIAKALK